nr:M15 family metallopeptidase [Nannocystis pusilla]
MPTYAIDCDEHEDVGYVQGNSFTITVVTVDGKPVEVETANAYYAMQQAAAADGVGIKVVSGFRTMAEQQYLYNCYINCNCNNCNLAAKPGYSNHQSGHALDLNTAAAGVLSWLEAHGDEFGFEATVPSEDWHWEWWGGGPPTSGPCGTPDYRAEYVGQSFPLASKPPVLLIVGECVDAWIDLRNTGDATWNGDTRLAPTPRDQPSPLHDPNTWLSPTRVATAGEVAPERSAGSSFACARRPRARCSRRSRWSRRGRRGSPTSRSAAVPRTTSSRSACWRSTRPRRCRRPSRPHCRRRPGRAPPGRRPPARAGRVGQRRVELELVVRR